jgi:hypothetical protein
MVITEEELREAWRNGQGQLPDLPPDARLTPAARDFLTARGLCPGHGAATCVGREACATSAAGAGYGGGDIAAVGAWLQGAASAMSTGGRMELRGEGGKRLIVTAEDVDGLVRSRPETVVVHPSATVTDAARERLRNAGIRVIPFTEKKPEPAEPISHNATAQPPSAADAALARERRAAAAGLATAADRSAAPLSPDKEELFRKAKPAIMARLQGLADEAVVDAVLRRVLGSL